jgi:hypothetical protein
LRSLQLISDYVYKLCHSHMKERAEDEFENFMAEDN